MDKIHFKDIGDFKNHLQFEAKLRKKHKRFKEPNQQQIFRILNQFKNKKYFTEFYKRNIQITKQAIKKSVTPDLLIIQTINSIEEIDKVSNTLIKRLREWYSIYNPEFSEKIHNHEAFVKLILNKDKKGRKNLYEKLNMPLDNTVQ